MPYDTWHSNGKNGSNGFVKEKKILAIKKKGRQARFFRVDTATKFTTFLLVAHII